MTVCHDRHSPQGKGSLIPEENHHIQIVLVDHNIVHVYRLIVLQTIITPNLT